MLYDPQDFTSAIYKRCNVIMKVFVESGIKISSSAEYDELFTHVHDVAKQSLTDPKTVDDEPADRRKTYDNCALSIIEDRFPDQYEAAKKNLAEIRGRTMIA